MMYLTTVFKNYLADSTVKLKKIEYTLMASNFSEESMVKNFKNRTLNWINAQYLFTYNFYLHILLKDDRLNVFKSIYYRAIFEKNGLEYEVPAFCFSDINSLGINKERAYELEPNWLVINLNSYDIKCSIYYASDTVINGTAQGFIIDKHFHITGDYGSSNKIRKIIPATGFNDVSVNDFGRGYKCLFSRGKKSFVRLGV